MKLIKIGATSGLFLMTMVVFLSCASWRNSGSRTMISIKGDQWNINGEPVLKDSPAEGLLMNVRMVNAVFEDMHTAAKDHLPTDFDPERNTERFIEKIPDYYAHGVRAFTISLQGGLPGYEGAVNTAFNPDGGLRQTYTDRVKRVIHAADEAGAVVILSCFYQRQNGHPLALDGKQSILNAVRNVAGWIRRENFGNVVLEISNEFAHGGYNRWKDGEWLKRVEGQLEMIQAAKIAAPELLVSTSGMGNGQISPAIGEAVDFIIVHFNRTPINLFPDRIREAKNYGKPVVCNEDDKVGKMGAEAARVSVQAGAGWGFMHLEKNQTIPFEFDGAEDDPTVYKMLSRLATAGASIDDIPGELFYTLITQPVDGDVFLSGKPVHIRAESTGIHESQKIEVHFFISDKLIGKCATTPCEIEWKNPIAGKHNVQAIVTGARGEALMRSGVVDFEVRE